MIAPSVDPLNRTSQPPAPSFAVQTAYTPDVARFAAKEGMLYARWFGLSVNGAPPTKCAPVPHVPPPSRERNA